MISFSFIEDLPSCKDNYQSREHRCLWIWNGFRYTLLWMGISTMLLCRSNNVFQKARYRDDENVIHFWLLFLKKFDVFQVLFKPSSFLRFSWHNSHSQGQCFEWKPQFFELPRTSKKVRKIESSKNQSFPRKMAW